ncbi:MAG: hypothetical protein Q8O19_00215, partial [Rectinemataceae bacterium]|nr:hypothetical protein [Rectinemataceae bacterium]
ISQVQDWAPVSGAIIRQQVSNGVIERRVKEIDSNMGTVTLLASAMVTAKEIWLLDMDTIRLSFIQGQAPLTHTWIDKPGVQATALRASGFFHTIFTLQVTNPAANGFIRLT